MYDVVIVGGGAVGCAVAYILAAYQLKVALLERNADVAMGTSGKNSAVVHAGFNNKPGSLMAKLCVQGNKMFEDLCETLGVPYQKCGKLVVAFDGVDEETLRSLVANAEANDSVGVRLIDRAQMDALEPGIGGISAMLSANTAVFDPFCYTIHLAEAAVANGVDFYLEHEVTAIQQRDGCFSVHAGGKTFRSKWLVNSAGLYADTVAAMAGDDRYKIYPCRGQYLILDKEAAEYLSRPIYPAPRKGLGGLGVHLTTSYGGDILIGPSAEYVEDKEVYATTPEVIEQLWSEAKQLLPTLRRDMIIGQYTGIRAKLVAKGESNFGDFIIEESAEVSRLINLVGIESPGLTASVPIAEMVAEIIGQKQLLLTNKAYQPQYKGMSLFRDLPTEQQEVLIAQDPEYGEIVCRCEKVTKAEVRRVLHNPLGATGLVSLKNRLRVTMGRCQGGYCLARLVQTMMQELNCMPEEIVFRKKGDTPFMGVQKA